MSGAIHVLFVVNKVTKRQVSLRVLLSYHASFILLIPNAHSSTVLGMDNGQLKVANRKSQFDRDTVSLHQKLKK